MTREENAKLFRLLRSLYRNAKDVTDDVEMAYYIVLKPYAYTDVREAVLSLAQRVRFFPDVADIVELLPEKIAAYNAEATADKWIKDKTFMEKLMEIQDEPIECQLIHDHGGEPYTVGELYDRYWQDYLNACPHQCDDCLKRKEGYRYAQR